MTCVDVHVARLGGAIDVVAPFYASALIATSIAKSIRSTAPGQQAAQEEDAGREAEKPFVLPNHVGLNSIDANRR